MSHGCGHSLRGCRITNDYILCVLCSLLLLTVQIGLQCISYAHEIKTVSYHITFVFVFVFLCVYIMLSLCASVMLHHNHFEVFRGKESFYVFSFVQINLFSPPSLSVFVCSFPCFILFSVCLCICGFFIPLYFLSAKLS